MSRETLSPRSIAWLRKKSQNQMVDSVLVKRPADPVFNEDTGNVDAPSETQVYRGAARVAPTSGPQTFVLGDELVSFSTTIVYLPWNAPIPQVHDFVHILDSRNSDLNGRILRVTDVQVGTNYTSRRMTCTQAEPGGL